MNIKPLSFARFEAFVGLTRSPATEFFSEELEWYADEVERLLGVVLLDTVDFDFSYVVLARDEHKQFRGIAFDASYPSLEAARSKLFSEMERLHTLNDSEFHQGDGFDGIDLFSPVTPPEKQNLAFQLIHGDEGHSSARGIIQEMMHHYQDVDGNFVEQFQSTGFDSRLWELYIFSYLNEEKLWIDRDYASPDFTVKKYGHEVCIEAVTVNPSQTPLPGIDPAKLKSPSSKEIAELLADYMPIKFGSPLFSKLNKRYWELPHVAGKPLVFAIADFHEPGSMMWSSSALFQYLYGVRHEISYDSNGQLVISTLKIDTHSIGEKKIPSGFFFQEDAQNISAVLFSASGTISKFNRMGKQAGFGSGRVKMIRSGFCHDHDPNASLPKPFTVEIKPDNYFETWGEGLSMYHNPNAVHPVPEALFPSIAHHHFVDGEILSSLPEFHPYSSTTLVISPKDK